VPDVVTGPRRRDDGFTLIELMVAIGIFALLMAMVSVILVNGIRSIRVATTANNVQAQQQNTMLELSQLVKYIDNPVNTGVPPAAILNATPTSMTFFTLSGSGNVDRLPYKVVACTTTRGVETFTWAPALVNGAAVVNTNPNMTVPACTDAGAAGSRRRILLPNGADTNPTLGFRYWRDRTAADGVGTGDVELVPTGSLTTAQLALLRKVQITLSDPALGTPLEQTVVLANER
jgi:prepilin-type N-terminal cleavage/methylation domain-containing protein